MIGFGGGGTVCKSWLSNTVASSSGWAIKPPVQWIVELPGRPGRPSTGEVLKFSCAAVVKADEVVVLNPLTTRSGGRRPSNLLL
jgi:hypothetical protein